jgi:hypothetical protein
MNYNPVGAAAAAKSSRIDRPTAMFAASAAPTGESHDE